MSNLTEFEIKDILSIFDDTYLGLDTMTRELLLERIKAPLRAELSQVVIEPCKIALLKAEIARIYRPVEAGKSIGIITAQSVGEMQTQMNLNVFHRAGHRDQQGEGASRLQELTCTSKSETQSMPMCSVYYKKDTAFTKEQMLRALTCKTFISYVRKTEATRLPEKLEPWETNWSEFYEQPLGEFKFRQVYELDKEALYRYRINLAEIAHKLSEGIAAEVDKNFVISFSPLYMAKICIYTCSERERTFIHKSAAATVLHGIEGIVQAYFLKINHNSDELFIETEGTNLEQIMNLPFVDTYNTVSSDMWEIYNLFGIEAVRQFLVEEFSSIMPVVHFAHIEFLADRMTVSGKLRSMTRYTRKNENASVLSKITFEETMQRSTDAAFREQKDSVSGCSSTVICGKPTTMGSGMSSLFLQQ